LITTGDNELVSEACTDNEDDFNYIEEVNGDIKLVHKVTGFCVHPNPKSGNTLQLLPCDMGKDMKWRNMAGSGSSWHLKNVYHNNCMVLPATTAGGAGQVKAGLAACSTSSNDQAFDFVKN
ncbi:MAG: hypothetical protein V3T30_06155, partial [Thermodesulfobacteriota bacterium]